MCFYLEFVISMVILLPYHDFKKETILPKMNAQKTLGVCNIRLLNTYLTLLISSRVPSTFAKIYYTL